MTIRRLKEWKWRFSKWATKHIRAIRIFIVVAMLLLAIWAITISRYDLMIGSSELALWFTEALVMVGPELAGIVIGVVAIDALNDWRQTEQLKAQLIRQMGSPIKDVAIPATKELSHHGWLYDGSLVGGNFWEACLDEADLGEANLKGADLEGAHLKGANLYGADLEGANLAGANLEQAKLTVANLEGANLLWANLKKSKLMGTNLESANIIGANLDWAVLLGAILKEANLHKASLKGTLGLTSEQLRDVKTVAGATMPDGVELSDPNGENPFLDGPTLEEWLAMDTGFLNLDLELDIDSIMATLTESEKEDRNSHYP